MGRENTDRRKQSGVGGEGIVFSRPGPSGRQLSGRMGEYYDVPEVLEVPEVPEVPEAETTMFHIP